MKILMTGASSFTGAHIARALLREGHEVVCAMTRSATSYNGNLEKNRFQLFSEASKIFEASFGSENLLNAIRDFKPEVFINHGANIKGYRSADFNVEGSIESSTSNGDQMFEALSSVGLKRFIHSGSVFEAIDGLEAYSKYGASKEEVSKILQGKSEESAIAFSKIYIPNPIGAFENIDRLVPLFVEKWKAGEAPELHAPRIVRDNLPAPCLANVNVEELNATSRLSLARPSGFKDDLKSFVGRFVLEASKRGVQEKLEFVVTDKVDPGDLRVNTENCKELGDPRAEAEFFDEWISSHWPESTNMTQQG